MNSLRRKYFYVLVAWLFYLTLAPANLNADNQFKEEEIVYSPALSLKGYLCRPEGEGPFAAVIYNHGGMGGAKIGGAPQETCQALAEAGFVGFSPLRRDTMAMDAHMEDVEAAVDFILNLEYVDEERLGMIGFSRGGHLAFRAAANRPIFKAIVLMAPAPGGGNPQKFINQAEWITAPVLLMAAQNDQGQADHVALSRKLKESLEFYDKDARMIIYPPFGKDGHQMFFKIGDYWQDVIEFLKEHL